MRIRKKKWVEPFLEAEGRYQLKERDLKAILAQYQKIFLELGMGMGDFICESAQREKDTLFIGYEKEATCVAKAIQKFTAHDLDNVLVIKDDVNNILEYFNKNIDVISLPFSDPWPKKGHKKRRLTNEHFLKMYEKVLKDDGKIVFKTDNSAFFDYSILSFLNEGYTMIEFSTDRHRDANDDVLTAYERKFKEEGQKIYYAVFKKKTMEL